MQMTSKEYGLSTSTEFFIVTILLLIEMNNIATGGCLAIMILYGDM